MAHFDVAVSEYMSSPVHAVSADTELPMVQHKLAELGISSLAVTDGNRLVGVVSRTDLLKVGRLGAGSRGRSALLSLPNQAVSEVMTGEPITVAPDDTITRAASLMADHRVHRVYVVRGNRLEGVVSTRDVAIAIRDKQAATPISELMSTPLFTVRADEPISLATERLERAKVSGLVVVDDDWPVGLFTQVEALECRDLPRSTRIDEVMDPGMICLPVTTKVHRAAEQAVAMRVRRIIAVEHREMQGILSGIDFARFAAV